jgi:hypothetical protein
MKHVASEVLEVSKINHRFISHLKKSQKLPLGPLGLFPSLTTQRILQTQPILSGFIQKQVIKVVNYLWCILIALVSAVTTRPGKYHTIA